MDQELSKFKKFVKFCKENGVKEAKIGEMQFSLYPDATAQSNPESPTAHVPVIPEQPDNPELIAAAADFGMSADEYKTLIWSTPGVA